jgi:hypothetical protein
MRNHLSDCWTNQEQEAMCDEVLDRIYNDAR